MIKRLLTRFKITSIYVTHDQIEAMALGDRIAVMRAGRIVQLGSYADLYEQPANDFVAGFLGLPSKNLFEGWLEGEVFTNGEVSLKLPEAFLPALSAGQPLKLGLRPEHVVLAERDDQANLMGLVEVVEPIPSERIQLVHLKTDLGACIAKWPIAQRIYLDSHLPLTFPDRDIHLFDLASGVRITPV
jgi:ABC-type sugar transport system ATPase subunit